IGKTNYTCHRIINEMLEILGTVVEEPILANISASVAIGLEVDETTDVSVKKQLDVHVRNQITLFDLKMVRFKKGKKKKALDLWQEAGGKYVSERGREHSIKKQFYSAPTGEEDEDRSQDDREISNAQPQSEIDTEESDQQSTETATEMTRKMNGKGQTGKDKKGPEKDKKRKTGTEPVGKDEDKNDEEKQSYSAPTGEEDETEARMTGSVETDKVEYKKNVGQTRKKVHPITKSGKGKQCKETDCQQEQMDRIKCKAGPKSSKLP
ncbi:Chromatin-remodeling complex ATPase chain isw-1, partial [Dissostichus eleginoides]